jgi:DNA-binding transcriptional LysR family regulator
MVELILKDAPIAIHLDRVYETDMAEGLKAMALEGHGVAFLPQSAVQTELFTRKLVSALPPELSGMHITMEVRAYRERPHLKEQQGAGAAPQRVKGVGAPSSAQVLWDYLQASAVA